jgi:hypothetical protein
MTLSPHIDTSVLDTSGVVTETLTMSPGGRFALDFIGAQETPRGQMMLIPPPAAQLTMDTSQTGLVNAFYAYFYPAHPFVLPRTQLFETLEKNRCAHLELALQYIGSFYVIGGNPEVFQAALLNVMHSSTPKDLFVLQAMLLMSIGLHMSGKEQDSAHAMHTTVTAAMELGLNFRSYGRSHGPMPPLMEECLRRTWWEIFVCDGMFAGVNPCYSVHLRDVLTDMDFPLEDEEYLSGVSRSDLTSSCFDHVDSFSFPTRHLTRNPKLWMISKKLSST